MRVSTSAVDGARERAPGIAPAILIVDDHAPNLLALEAVLAPLGHRIVRATSGEEALRRVLQEDFAVILLDVMMPGLDGFQTAAILKQRDRSRATPIIFLTALTLNVDLAAGYAHGAVDYLVKPFDPLILRAKVEVFVELYRSREEIARQAAALRDRELERDQLRREMTQSLHAREQAESREAAQRIVAESIPQQVWTARSDGALDYVNPVVLRYFDQTEAAVLGAGWQAVIHPDDLPACLARWSESLKSGRDYEVEFRLRRHDGAYRWHLGRAVPQRDGDGRLVRWFGTNTDIDDRRRAEAELRRQDLALRQSEERFQLLAEVIPQMVWSTDAQGHDAYLSPRWYEYTGQPREMPFLDKWRAAIHPEDYDRCFARIVEAQAQHVPWELELRLRRADGVYRFHLGRSVPHRDGEGNVTRWFGTATDIDEQRRAIRSRDDLLATVSHDLRNPLGAVTLAAALLRRTPVEGDVGVKLARHLGTIERAATRMEQLISDLLDLARIESGHLAVELHAHDVAELIAEAIEAIQPQATAKQLRLESVVNARALTVSCDRGRAQQVFSNLLGNAVKFTPSQGRITITAGLRGRLVQFAVADSGPGMARDQLPYIFDRFWQAKATARAGTGLGLAICKGIVEQHGGTIRVESEPGTGTTFHFTLPAADVD